MGKLKAGVARGVPLDPAAGEHYCPEPISAEEAVFRPRASRKATHAAEER